MDEKHSKIPLYLALGLAAGCINGIFGAAGGLILIPGLMLFRAVAPEAVFPLSVSVMLPVSLVSLFMSAHPASLPWAAAWPYLAGGILGGIAACIWGNKVPLVWLHRILGIMILWGGIRYLC